MWFSSSDGRTTYRPEGVDRNVCEDDQRPGTHDHIKVTNATPDKGV